MKSEVLDQPFTTAVLAFTDGTAEELKKASAGDVANVNAMGPGQEMQTLCRNTLTTTISRSGCWRMLSEWTARRLLYGEFERADLLETVVVFCGSAGCV